MKNNSSYLILLVWTGPSGPFFQIESFYRRRRCEPHKSLICTCYHHMLIRCYPILSQFLPFWVDWCIWYHRNHSRISTTNVLATSKLFWSKIHILLNRTFDFIPKFLPKKSRSGHSQTRTEFSFSILELFFKRKSSRVFIHSMDSLSRYSFINIPPYISHHIIQYFLRIYLWESPVVKGSFQI